MSSLFKRASLPLLAVTASTLTASICAPARAATASMEFYGPVNLGTSNQGVVERAECVVAESSSAWWQAEFHAFLLGGGDSHSATKNPWYAGQGDWYYPVPDYTIYLGPTISGTYDCWVICDVGSSGGNTAVSTGGTDYATF